MSEFELKSMHISMVKVYQFKSITFEWHDYFGPVFLRRKDHEPKPEQLRPNRDWGLLHQWIKMGKKKREDYRVF